MKLDKILKKIIASFLLTVLIIGKFGGLKLKTEAVTIETEDGDYLYLGLSALGEEIGYAMPNTSGNVNEDTLKNIWSIKSYESDSIASPSVVTSNLYCIKAGFGYTWESVDRNAVLTYTSEEFNKDSVDGYYDEILWLIDHMYVQGEDNKEVFLNSIGIVSRVDSETGEKLYYYDSAVTGYEYSELPNGEYEYTLTDGDIVAIQQAAIWYYTNYKVDTANQGAYNQLGNNTSWLKYTTDGSNYADLSGLNSTSGEGPARNEFSIILYNYLINKSTEEISKLGSGETYNLSNKNVKLWTSVTNGNAEQPIIEIHQKEKTGKYNVILVKEDASGVQLNSTATFIVNNVEQTVTGKLTIASDVQITKDNLSTTDTYVIKENTPPDEYCEFDGTITVSVTKKETTEGYEVNTVTYVVTDSSGNDITNQIGEDVNVYLNQDGNIYVEVKNYPEEKAFDLALRKVITSVTDNEGKVKAIVNEDEYDATRNVTVDKTTLNNEDDNTDTDTATYKHRKDPVLVEKGDKVKYTITIYNEGEQAGYATKIIDQLPGTAATGLRLLSTEDITSSTGNTYSVEYSTTTNKVTFTLKSATPQTILAYDGTTLREETITLECEVMTTPSTTETMTLTNIAYIAEEFNAVKNETITVTGDRDSQPETYPSYSKENDAIQDGITYGEDNGYTGKEGNSNDLSKNGTYYKGQQDDDDFEKLVILPEAFDLSLRKVITEIDGTATGEDREINITGLAELANRETNTTTAEYNHVKVPLVVKNKSNVKYNINVYNEGTIDGIATIIRDQLPTGLKLDYTSLQDRIVDGETQYYINTTKNNKYIVEYDENTNIITFKLDATATETNLQAFEGRTELDNDTLEFACTVDCVADESKTTYLTNIAYIYEAKKVDGTVITNQEKEDRDSEPYTKPDENKDALKTIGNIGYTGNSSNPAKLDEINTYYKGEQDDDDFEKIVIAPQAFDLKLIKYIDELNGEYVGNRILNVDTSKLNTIGADGNKITTAEYEMDKNPVGVKAGDFIKYTFRIYNEGDYDGYATEISENIPSGLEMLTIRKEAGNTIIETWDGENLKDVTEEIKATGMYEEIVSTNGIWGYSQGTSIITTTGLQDELIKAYGIEGYSEYADKENKIDYKEISVIFRVKVDLVKENENPIRNEAAITQDKAVDENGDELINSSGNPIGDRDSKPEEWKKEDSGKDYNDDGWEIYKEDDEDYDNVILKEFDLSLRKQIVTITRNQKDDLYIGRYARLDNSETNTIYNYYNVYNNKPTVRPGDIITYSIRVYNEGEIDGYANLVVDTLPSGLEFVPYTEGDGSTNDIYGWKLVEGTTNVYETDYLSYENDTNKETNDSTIIKAYTGTGEADFEELLIQCKVKEDVTKEDSLLNVAQIADDSDEDGKTIRDKDSEPGKTDNEENWKEEDDLDIEIVQLEEFDLALRKFITEIEETGSETGNPENDGEPNITEVIDRIPQISYDKETNQITYTHTKEPLVVHVGDTVIYTIRVYNEGEIDGYAKEITDNIPEYLEYLPNHNTNQEFEWKMYDENGDETDDVSKAVKIKTTYLSKENSEENLIKAFKTDAEINETNPDYKDVKVAFKVNDPDSSEYIIENFAQISDDSDAEGEPIKDKDSEPDNGEGTPKEDDEDIEKIKVQYFDLALLKYVTKVIVTEDGQQTITETGNVGDENDIVPKVEINRKKLNSTVVKFAYTIKITNEGEIAGYAKEITDYIPEGLKFNAEDNPNWTDEGNNIISTRQLEDVLLQPGESSEVEVILTWINGENNLGPKINVAEISEDDNDEGVPDKDSTPDNKKDGEDDIDDAEVILSIKTGGGLSDIYTKLILGLCVIILIGIVLIKKYVL